MPGEVPSAAAVIIGDEILSGKFVDENGPFLIRRLRSLGTSLQRLVVLADRVDAIAHEVRHCSDRFDHVFTSGGVGPTHDDLTLEGVGAAFGLDMEIREELVSLMRHYDMKLDDAGLRMARVPCGAELIRTKSMSYPVLRVRNVYVLPGVPKLFRSKFEAISDRFAGPPVHTDRIFTLQLETEIAAALTETALAFASVAIGSYPRYEEGDFHVIVTLESRDPGALEEAKRALEAVLQTTTR